MKYFSEITNKVYDTQADLEKAEAEVTNKKNQRWRQLSQKRKSLLSRHMNC